MAYCYCGHLMVRYASVSLTRQAWQRWPGRRRENDWQVVLERTFVSSMDVQRFRFRQSAGLILGRSPVLPGRQHLDIHSSLALRINARLSGKHNITGPRPSLHAIPPRSMPYPTSLAIPLLLQPHKGALCGSGVWTRWQNCMTFIWTPNFPCILLLLLQQEASWPSVAMMDWSECGVMD